MTPLVREMGPVLASLMLAGRVGSAIAAELGSMVVSEQVDAMRALGTDPIKKLVWPRLLALMVMCPALTAVADMVGSIGGGAGLNGFKGVPSSGYDRSAQEAVAYNGRTCGVVRTTCACFIILVVATGPWGRT